MKIKNQVLLLDRYQRMIKMISVKQAINKSLSKKAIIKLYSNENLNQKYKKPLVIMDLILNKQDIQKQSLQHNRRLSDQALLFRDNYQCQYCGFPLTLQSITRDHVIPLAKDGNGKGQNIVSCCYTCNQKKRDRTLQQSGMKLLKQVKQPSYFYQTSQMKQLYRQYINSINRQQQTI